MGPEDSRQVGPASLGEAGRPRPVAILRGLFAQVQVRLFYSREVVLVIVQKSQAGRPSLSRLACFSFGFRQNFSGICILPSHLVSLCNSQM